jgi:hypothetical protein
LPDFIKYLRKIPKTERKFNYSKKQWEITLNELNKAIVEKGVELFFESFKEVLILGIGLLRVGGLETVYYERDYYKPVSNEIFHTIYVKRIPPEGSRKYPQFNGFVLVKAKINQNITIKGDYVKYYECTAENIDNLIELINKLPSKSYNEEVKKEAIDIIETTPLSTLPDNKASSTNFNDILKNIEHLSEEPEVALKYIEKVKKDIDDLLNQLDVYETILKNSNHNQKHNQNHHTTCIT